MAGALHVQHTAGGPVVQLGTAGPPDAAGLPGLLGLVGVGRGTVLVQEALDAGILG